MDPNGNAWWELDWGNRESAIRTIEHTFNEVALCITRSISKLWHGLENSLNSKTSNPSRFFGFGNLQSPTLRLTYRFCHNEYVSSCFHSRSHRRSHLRFYLLVVDGRHLSSLSA